MGKVIKATPLDPEHLAALTSGRDIIEQATRSAEAIVTEAERRGFERGQARAAATLAAARETRADARSDGLDDLVELSLEIARSLYDRARETDPQVMRDLCREALSKMTRAQRVTLRVNPEDLEAASTLTSTSRAMTVVSDPEIGAGGCVVTSDLGTVDGRIETRLAALERAMTEVVCEDGDDRR